MKIQVVILVCVFTLTPCLAKTITVEAPKPVSVVIEADDFEVGTDISNAFDGIIVSGSSGEAVRAVPSVTNLAYHFGTNAIGHGENDQWRETFRISFQGAAKKISVLVTGTGTLSSASVISLRTYNMANALIGEVKATAHANNPDTLTITHTYFDIAYATVTASGGRKFCLDHIVTEFLPVYQGDADFDKIQDAIDHAASGDIVEVWPGTYYERIDFYGMPITVTSVEPDNPTFVGQTIIDAGRSGNAVTFVNLEDSSSLLKGFTVRYADIGIKCHYSNPVIANCVLSLPSTTAYGVHCFSAAPTITDTNISGGDVGVYGCQGEIVNCSIKNSQSTGLLECSGIISECTISGNKEAGLASCTGEITNCLITKNKGDGVSGCYADILNCTIVGNKGNGVTGAVKSLVNNIIVKNFNFGVESIANATSRYNNIWGNLNGVYSNVAPSSLDIHRNPVFVQDGYWDDNNNWQEGNYLLKSETGRANGMNWFLDDVTSPCIDAGDPVSDIGIEPNPNGGRINMGAYGGTAKASKSMSGVSLPVCQDPPIMDFTDDCIVNLADFARFTVQWLNCGLDIQEACWQ